MDKVELIQKIENVLCRLRDPSMLLSPIMLECKEIACLLDDNTMFDWAVNQLEGYKDSIPLAEYRAEVKKGQELITFCDPLAMLEQKLQQQYDIPTNTEYDNIYGSIKIRIVQEKKAILETLNWIRQKAHTYLVKKLVEMKSGYLPEQIFAETRCFVDERIGNISPEIAERFAGIYDDLSSSNQAKWANAILSCREILRHLADALCPAKKETKSADGHKLGPESYRNRLIEYVKQRQNSETFTATFGSALGNFVDILEAIHAASCAGKFICRNKAEAKRHVIYTYMLVSDILSVVDGA